jgi:hypothetical protein
MTTFPECIVDTKRFKNLGTTLTGKQEGEIIFYKQKNSDKCIKLGILEIETVEIITDFITDAHGTSPTKTRNEYRFKFYKNSSFTHYDQIIEDVEFFYYFPETTADKIGSKINEISSNARSKWKGIKDFMMYGGKRKSKRSKKSRRRRKTRRSKR